MLIRVSLHPQNCWGYPFVDWLKSQIYARLVNLFDILHINSNYSRGGSGVLGLPFCVLFPTDSILRSNVTKHASVHLPILLSTLSP